MSQNNNPQRQIPSIDSLLRSEQGQEMKAGAGHELTRDALQAATLACRSNITTLTAMDGPEIQHWLLDYATNWLNDLMSPALKKVLNLTGTVLHTNLGRAPLPRSSIEAMITVASGASNLEYDLDKGKRGDRDDHVEAWLCRLTGAEAATVVNNNAAAVMLTLNSLAFNKAVAVSRGELVEIGGSFRIPDIMKRANCQLLEVGTTNRTHPRDYSQAATEGVCAIMRVHTSNFEVQGFTKSVPDKELADIARQHNIPFINDLGSGALTDLTKFGLPAEATARDAIAQGSNVVTFSGDKLLGGPQCGLIVGDTDCIERIRKNPIKRALRCDKVTLAALESVLRLYANPEQLAKEIPTLGILTKSTDDIEAMAATVAKTAEPALAEWANVRVEPCHSQIGSGALPVDLLPSSAIVLTPKLDKRSAVEDLAAAFRHLPVPVIGRIHDGELWFDLRCLPESETFTRDLDLLKPPRC